MHKRKQHLLWCKRLLSTVFAGLETNTIRTDGSTRRFGGKHPCRTYRRCSRTTRSWLMFGQRIAYGILR